MNNFSWYLNLIFRNYEGYFTFGSYEGVVIDGKTTFLTLPYSFENNINALGWAAEHGRLEVVKYLVAREANIHAKNDDALRLAAMNGHLEVVKYLVAQGANIHANNDEALRWAAWAGHLNTIKYLVAHPEVGAERQGADIQARDDALRSAAWAGHLNIIKYLVDYPEVGAERQGVSIHARDDALFSSAWNGYLDMVKYLVAQGANIHTKNDDALSLAAENGHLEVVKYLIDHPEVGAKRQGGRRWPFGPSSYGAQALVEAADIQARDDALRRATENGHLDVVAYLKDPQPYNEEFNLYRYLSR